MSHAKTLLFVPLVAIASGCIVLSQQPLADPKSFVDDDRLIGSWHERPFMPGDQPTSWLISRQPDNPGAPLSVKITRDGKTFSHAASLARIGDSLYLDIWVRARELPGFQEQYGDITLHDLARLSFKDGYAVLQPCDAKKIRTLLKEQPNVLKTEDAAPFVILKSETAQLQTFFNEHGASAFGEPTLLKRVN